jgi:hypothetical protein
MNLEKRFSKNLRKVLKGIFFMFDPFSVKQTKNTKEMTDTIQIPKVCTSEDFVC